ncbi:UNVERIFIED_CONTAM: hypothetical protein GTU68_025104, partial [Idotea baltica]|nr:hypothetical protein [Idotea baltica]
MTLDKIQKISRSYSNLIENENLDSADAWDCPHPNSEVFTNSSYILRPLICRPQRLWHRFMLCRFTRKISWRYLILFAFILVTIFILYIELLSESSGHILIGFMRKQPPVPVFHCTNSAIFLPHQHALSNTSNVGRLRDDPKVLLFAETQYSRHGKSIAELLVANRIKYKMEVIGKSLPLLTDFSKGKFGAIVFENIERYLGMDQWNRELLDKYMIEYKVGIIGFFPQSGPTKTYAKLHNFPLYVTSSPSLTNISLNEKNPILRLTRPGDTITTPLQGYNWSLFIP